MGEKTSEESLLKTWSEAQQRVLAGWLDLVQGTEGLSRMRAWNETVKAWQTAVQETLDAQARWLRDWTGRVQVTSGSPTDLRKNVQQAQMLLLRWTDRKSTRLNSSHSQISYAVFCLKKKKKKTNVSRLSTSSVTVV